jgi:hypothetical protein
LISAAQSTGLGIQVIQDLLDNQRILNGRDYSNRTATVIADCDIDIKHALKPLCPGHFLMLMLWRLYIFLAYETLRIAALGNI